MNDKEVWRVNLKKWVGDDCFAILCQMRTNGPHQQPYIMEGTPYMDKRLQVWQAVEEATLPKSSIKDYAKHIFLDMLSLGKLS